MNLSRLTTVHVIAAALAILLIPAMALADDFLDDVLLYSFLDNVNSKVSVCGIRNAHATRITIPSTVVYEYSVGTDDDGNPILERRTYSVTSIGNEAFYNCSGLTHVAIPSSVTSIGERAFAGCSGLVDVTIPDSVTSIGGAAFYGCRGLTRVTIPDHITRIEYSVFNGCSGLTRVTLPDSVTSIGAWAFEDCRGLTHVTIPGRVTSIGDGAFFGCDGLTSVTIPDSVTSIGGLAFYGCRGLTRVTIPGRVTSIGESAFECCSGLRRVTIPDSMTSIGAEAFYNCSGLKSVTILGNITNDYSFYGPFGPFRDCTNIVTLVLGDKMTKIGTWMFFGCSSLTSVTIPDSVTSIGEGAFSDCDGLTSMTIPDSVTSIGDSAFYGCSGLTSVTISESVTSIGDSAFYGCNGLTSMTIPDSVTSIGDGAFMCCSGLKSVTILGNITNDWGTKNSIYPPFFDCTNLTTVVLGDKMTKIGNYMFNSSGLTRVTIPESVTSIGNYAFGYCNGLTRVTISDGVTDIGMGAFVSCASLSDVWFNGGVPTVHGWTFSGVASGARGHYTAVHASEWLQQIEANGKWQGLIMADVSGPMLVTQSANPAEGSLTLAWEDEGVGEGVTYSVYRSANDTYSATNLVTNGLTETTWTDTDYWAAEPVLKPLNYWVVADGGGYGERVSEPVETRRRYGLFVGVGNYKDKRHRSDPTAKEHAKLFGKLASENGDFTSVEVLTGSGATKKAFRKALQNLAEKPKTGDFVALFCSSHGGAGSDTGPFTGITMYDTLADKRETSYTKAELKEDLTALINGENQNGEMKNGLSVVFIMNTCFSEGAISASPENSNIAWIWSCKESEETTSFFTGIGAPLPHFILEYGWNRGKAGKGHGTMATFKDLVVYLGTPMSKFQNLGLMDEHWNYNGDAVLSHFIAGRLGDSQYAGNPDVPIGLKVVNTDEEGGITIQWNREKNAEYYIWRRIDENDGTQIHGMLKQGDNDPMWLRDSGKGEISYLSVQSYQYQLAALNENGISTWCKTEKGTRVNPFWQWLVEQYLKFKIDESTPIEMVATAAASPSANGASYEACYIADIDPHAPEAAFTVELLREEGQWKAKPKGGEKEGRVYRVEGKKEMSDEDWTDVTEVEDLEAEGWRFFRVGVELAE